MKTVLYRSETDRMLGGVCGGLSDYLGIDSTFVRLFFALLFFGSGVGLLAYLALWIIMPSESTTFAGTTWKENIKDSTENFNERAQNVGKDFQQAMRSPHPQAGLIVGIALIALGGLLFIENLGIPWLNWLSFDMLWPVLLIVGGGALLLRRTQEV
jgi:phage shock protein PspC (stress-responsive transcriptional regulator)